MFHAFCVADYSVSFCLGQNYLLTSVTMTLTFSALLLQIVPWILIFYFQNEGYQGVTVLPLNFWGFHRKLQLPTLFYCQMLLSEIKRLNELHYNIYWCGIMFCLNCFCVEYIYGNHIKQTYCKQDCWQIYLHIYR